MSRRRFQRRRRSVKPYRRKKQSLAKKAWKEVTKLKKAVESKYISRDIANASFNFLGNTWEEVEPLIAQGTRNDQRLGNKVTMTQYSAKWKIARGVTDQSKPLSFRVTMILDRRNNGAGPPADSVLIDDSNIVSAINNHNPTYRGRYQILYDKIHTFSDQTAREVFFKIYLRKPIVIEYKVDQTGGNAAAILKNCLFLKFTGPGFTASSTSITAMINAKFIDL